MKYQNHEGYPDPTPYGALQNIARDEAALRRLQLPLVYICSPYAGDIEYNLQKARDYSAFAVMKGVLPIAPHLLLPQFIGEETYETRLLALRMGMILLDRCQELWYFGDTISDGMREEIKKARWRHIPIHHYTDDCTEVLA